MLSLVSSKPTFRTKPLAAAPTLVLAQGDSGYLYLLASPKGKQWLIESFGELKFTETEKTDSRLGDGEADFEPSGRIWPDVLSQKWQNPNAAEIRSRRVVLCLQRPEIEFYSLQTSFDPSEDPTEALQNELLIREKIALDEMVVDYFRHEFTPDETILFAAGVPRNNLDELSVAAKNNGLKLEQAFVRSLAVASIIESLGDQEKNGNSIAEIQTGSCLLLAVYGAQADLVLLHKGKPCFIRNLVLPVSSQAKEIATQLISEIRLSISSLDFQFLDDALAQAVVIAETRITTELIIQLKIELDLDSVQVRVEDLPSIRCSEDSEVPAEFLPLLGSLHQSTLQPGPAILDLLNPKQPVEPPSMVRRIALLSVLLAIVLGYFGMSLYDKYQANHQEIVKVVTAARKDKAAYEKGLPDAQLVQFVQRWQEPEVQWLEQLRALTEKLPSGDLAVIRQFSGQQTTEGAKISMQIHVRDLEVAKAIEQSIVESGLRLEFRRVAEIQDESYPLRLETTVLAPHQISAASDPTSKPRNDQESPKP